MRLVLLSGGLDSVAAMHWAIDRGGRTHAVGFRYGQPHVDAELYAAGTIAARREVPFATLLLPELKQLDPTAGRDKNGVSRAFVPGRNALFLARAAAHGAPIAAMVGEPLVLVCGANKDDATGFPDCRPAFFDAMEVALATSLDGVCKVSVETPWLNTTKADILRWAAIRPAALADARDSVSCYRGTRCGICDACTLRARAFAEVGISDGTTLPVFSGGDPGREAALRR